MSLTIYTVELTKALIDFVEDFSSQQTETAVSNNNKCITKSRPTKFYSTLCHTAKRTQRYNLIRSTQNNSTSVEQNCQPLAQNKFNNCPPTQKSNGPPPVAKQITFARAATRVASNYLTTIIIIIIIINFSLRIGFI